MRTASGPESIREANKVLLVYRIQHRDSRSLDDLVFEGGDTPGIMHLIQFALGMTDPDDPNSRPILAEVDQRRC